MGKITTILKIVISLSILIFIFDRIQLSELVAAFRKVDLPVFISGSVVGLLSLLIQIGKWHLLLQQVEPKAGLKDSLRSFFCGMALGIISPGRAGEFGRAIFVQSSKRGLLVEMTVIDKISAVMAICFLAAWSFRSRETFHLVFIFSGLTGALIFLCVYWKYIRTKGGGLLRLKKRFGLQSTSPAEFSYSNRIGWLVVILAIAMFSLVTFEFYLLLLCFEWVEWKAVVSVFPVILLINLVPIAFAGIGVREAAAILLLSDYHVSQAAALNASFLIFFLNIFSPALIGGLWILLISGGKSKFGAFSFHSKRSGGNDILA